jgi:hypothetical protein
MKSPPNQSAYAHQSARPDANGRDACVAQQRPRERGDHQRDRDEPVRRRPGREVEHTLLERREAIPALLRRERERQQRAVVGRLPDQPRSEHGDARQHARRCAQRGSRERERGHREQQRRIEPRQQRRRGSEREDGQVARMRLRERAVGGEEREPYETGLQRRLEAARRIGDEAVVRPDHEQRERGPGGRAEHAPREREHQGETARERREAERGRPRRDRRAEPEAGGHQQRPQEVRVALDALAGVPDQPFPATRFSA